MAAVRGLAFVSYPVTDLARAVAFYRDAIGLTPGESFGDEVAEFDLGEAVFSVDVNAICPPGTQAAAAFEVDDAAGMRRSLVAQGVPVTELFDNGVCFAAIVTDLDGNRFMLHERKARRTRP